MATTNHELEAKVFGSNPRAEKIVQELLANAANAYKYMNKMFGKKKYALYLKAATYDLNELSKLAGSLENTIELIEVVKEIYPNWADSYAIIDALLTNSKKHAS